MKALVIAEKNAAPVWSSVADPVASPGEAIVRVHAAALNHRDVWIQRGQYAGLRYPIVVGSDGAGVVVATSGDTAWVGKEVIINAGLHWGDQETHQSSTGFAVLGLPDDGTLAEYVRVPMGNLIGKPEHLGWEEAAALPLAGVTAYRALMVRAQARPGERALVTGVGGGVALFALQFAVAHGARVYVSSGSDEKIALATGLGALGGVNYKDAGWAGASQGG